MIFIRFFSLLFYLCENVRKGRKQSVKRRVHKYIYVGNSIFFSFFNIIYYCKLMRFKYFANQCARNCRENQLSFCSTRNECNEIKRHTFTKYIYFVFIVTYSSRRIRIIYMRQFDNIQNLYLQMKHICFDRSFHFFFDFFCCMNSFLFVRLI